MGALLPVLRARAWELGPAQERDLRAHERAVGGVEGDQRIRARVAAGVPVGIDEDLAEALAAERGQIEHEEGEVVGHVQLAQPGVELDAVDDSHAIAEEDVFGAEVPVALADLPAAGARPEGLGVGGHERVREPLETQHSLDLAALLDVAEQLLEVALEAALGREHGRAVRRHPRRVLVKAGQAASELHHVLSLQLASLEPGRQRLRLVVPAHLDHEVDRARVVLVGQLDPVLDTCHAANAEIQVGRQAAVQPHLGLAQLPPARRGSVVEEVEDERLFQLVGELAGEEHPRDVRLAHLHRRRPVRIRLGARQRLPQRLGPSPSGAGGCRGRHDAPTGAGSGWRSGAGLSLRARQRHSSSDPHTITGKHASTISSRGPSAAVWKIDWSGGR